MTRKWLRRALKDLKMRQLEPTRNDSNVYQEGHKRTSKCVLNASKTRPATKWSIHNKTISTFSASVEFHSHGNVSVPAPWVNLNKPRFDWWKESVLYDCVLVSVTSDVLKRQRNKGGLRLRIRQQLSNQSQRARSFYKLTLSLPNAAKGKFRPNFQILFSTILTNK